MLVLFSAVQGAVSIEALPVCFSPARHLRNSPSHMDRFRNNFYLETMIPQFADNLKSLRGFKFDWTRNDANYDHVYANQALTRKLNEFGVAHGAEEYTGPFDESNWGPGGRIYTEVLPFFRTSMVFVQENEHSQR